MNEPTVSGDGNGFDKYQVYILSELERQGEVQVKGFASVNESIKQLELDMAKLKTIMSLRAAGIAIGGVIASIVSAIVGVAKFK